MYVYMSRNIYFNSLVTRCTASPPLGPQAPQAIKCTNIGLNTIETTSRVACNNNNGNNTYEYKHNNTMEYYKNNNKKKKEKRGHSLREMIMHINIYTKI